MTRHLGFCATLVLCGSAIANPLGQLNVPTLPVPAAKAIDRTDLSIPGFVCRLMDSGGDGDAAGVG
jgi:hypothetical protein